MEKDNEEPIISDHETVEHIDSYFNGDEECIVAKKMAESLATLDKPFGISWDLELVKVFLEARGYKVIVRLSEDGDKYYSVFFPGEDDDCISDEQNIMRVFSAEVQGAIINWLLSITGEEE